MLISFSLYQIIVSSEGKNATTLIRIHIDSPSTTRKPKTTTTLRTTTTDRSTISNTRLSTIQQNPTFSTEDVEVFDDTTKDDRGSLVKNDNLERQEPQEFSFSVKENQARKYIDRCNHVIIF